MKTKSHTTLTFLRYLREPHLLLPIPRLYIKTAISLTEKINPIAKTNKIRAACNLVSFPDETWGQRDCHARQVIWDVVV